MNKIVLAREDLDSLIKGNTVVAHNSGPNLADECIVISTVEGDERQAVAKLRLSQIEAAEIFVLKVAATLKARAHAMTERERFEMLWQLGHVNLQSLEDYRPWRDL